MRLPLRLHTHLCPGHGFFPPVDVRRLLQGGIISDMTWTLFDFDARGLRKGPVTATVQLLQGWIPGRTGQQVRDCHWMPLLEVKTVAVFVLEFSRCDLNVIAGPMMIDEDNVYMGTSLIKQRLALG